MRTPTITVPGDDEDGAIGEPGILDGAHVLAHHRVELGNHGQVHAAHATAALDRIEIVGTLGGGNASLEHRRLERARVHFFERLPFGYAQIIGDFVKPVLRGHVSRMDNVHALKFTKNRREGA